MMRVEALSLCGEIQRWHRLSVKNTFGIGDKIDRTKRCFMWPFTVESKTRCSVAKQDNKKRQKVVKRSGEKKEKGSIVIEVGLVVT